MFSLDYSLMAQTATRGVTFMFTKFSSLMAKRDSIVAEAMPKAPAVDTSSATGKRSSDSPAGWNLDT